jgi:hypothetical protein
MINPNAYLLERIVYRSREQSRRLLRRDLDVFAVAVDALSTACSPERKILSNRVLCHSVDNPGIRSLQLGLKNRWQELILVRFLHPTGPARCQAANDIFIFERLGQPSTRLQASVLLLAAPIL